MAKADMTRIEASISGDALVVASSSAMGAKIWRAPMSTLSHAAFELRELQGRLTVVAIPMGGIEEEVCVCPDRASALYALDKISAALFAGVAPGQTARDLKKPGWGAQIWRVCKIMLIAAGVALFLALASIFLFGGSGGGGVSGDSSSTAVPVPADQLIGK